MFTIRRGLRQINRKHLVQATAMIACSR